MKDVILALCIGFLIIYELTICIKARSYVRACYQSGKEDDKAIKMSVGCMTIFYLFFLILGLAIGEEYYIYGIVLLLGIIGSFITSILKNGELWGGLLFYKRLDSIITMVLFAWLFFQHFHPEMIEMYL